MVSNFYVTDSFQKKTAQKKLSGFEFLIKNEDYPHLEDPQLVQIKHPS